MTNTQESQRSKAARLTGRQRYDLYWSIRTENPDASIEQVRELYRQALRSAK